MKHLKNFNESFDNEEERQDMIDYIVGKVKCTDISLLKAIGDEIGRTDDTPEEYRTLLSKLPFDQLSSIYMDVMNSGY